MKINVFKQLAKHLAGRTATEKVDKTPYDLYRSSRSLPTDNPLCLAPWTSISFGVDGTATVCCLNRKTVVDTVGKTIDEVWNSREIEELRSNVLTNNLDHDCGLCKNQILSQNFDGLKASDYDDYYPVKADRPQVMEFCLDNTCNLECDMCNSRLSSSIRKSKGLPRQKRHYNDAFVSQLDEYIPHLKEAIFVGGEPFLIPLYYEIWNKIIAINPDVIISVVTNGTVLTEEIKQLLELGRFKITLSLDSVDKDSYQSIRKNADHDHVIRNFTWFRDYCSTKGTSMNLAVCPMTINWRSLPDTVRFANANEVYLNFAYVERPIQFSLIYAETQLLDEIIGFFEAQSFEKTTTSSPNVSRFNGLINNLKLWRENSNDKGQRNEVVQRLDTIKKKLLEEVTNESEQKIVQNFLAAVDGLSIEYRERVLLSISNVSAYRLLRSFDGLTPKQIKVLLTETVD